MLRKMKCVVAVSAGVIAGALLAVSSADAQVSVGASMTDNGAYVALGNRSDPGSTAINNDSYRANATPNPYTGAVGVDEYQHSPSLGPYGGPSLNTPMTPDHGISTYRRSGAYRVHPSYGLGDNR